MVLRDGELNKRFSYVEFYLGGYGYLLESDRDFELLSEEFPEINNAMIKVMLRSNRRAQHLVVVPRLSSTSVKRTVMKPSFFPKSAISNIFRSPLSDEGNGKYSYKGIEGFPVWIEEDLSSLDGLPISNEKYSKILDLVRSGEEVFVFYEDFNFNYLLMSRE